MKQRNSKTCDSYISELRLALPECKYKNDVDELLKDQFIFGFENKEIQDHLLGEISETDNSVRALYEAPKIESKLVQRKMLGIVNPSSLVSIDLSKRARILNFTQTVNFVVDPTIKVSVLPLEKCVIVVVERTTSKQNVLRKSQIGPMVQNSWIGPMEENVHIDVMCMK